MPRIPAALRGIRAKLLAPPAVLLIFMAVLGAIALHELRIAADLSVRSRAATAAVELLRDANSRQFESDRFQHLAMHAHEPGEQRDAIDEATGVLAESAASYARWSKNGPTAEARAQGARQVELLRGVGAGRRKILEWAAANPGLPITDAIDKVLDRTEGRVDASDELNDAMVTAQRKVNERLAKDAKASESRGRTLMISLLLLGTVVGIALALVMARSVTRPVQALLERLRRLHSEDVRSLHSGLLALAEGDLTLAAAAPTEPVGRHGRDEIGRLGETVDELLAATAESVEAYNASRAQLGALVGDVRRSAGTVTSSSREVAATSGEAGRAVGEIAEAAGDVALGAERQVRMIEAAREAAQTVATEVHQTAASAQQTVEVADEARVAARDGVSAAAEVTAAMSGMRESSESVATAIDQLAGRSERIGQIVGTITQIAEQTNLLALNAAIEAARAGEQGRGFAVVAEEVRKLAEGSQAAAGSIAGLVEEIQAETRRVVAMVEDGAGRTAQGAETVARARGAFERIGTAVEDMCERIGVIADAAVRIEAGAGTMEQAIGEVAAVAEQSSASSEQMSAGTQETSASTQQIAGSAQELTRTAEELDGLVKRFRLTA